MRVYYSDHRDLPLPAAHRFPLAKYRRLRERLQQSDVAGLIDLQPAPAAEDEQLRLVHSSDYLARLVRGELSALEQRRIGFPWSPQLLVRSRHSTGGTLAAAEAACRDGVSVHLAGGTHHAFPDHGQGFCVFNDVAVATRSLQATQQAQRVVVLDCDVHQGNGTASIFLHEQTVFTVSLHGERNFPFAKQNGDLDLALPDGATDEQYLGALETALDQSPLKSADCLFYLAGADPFSGDRLGRMNVTKNGLRERDRLVFERCRQQELPVAVVMAGGYAENVEDIVDIHATTVRMALASFLSRRRALRQAD